MAVSKEKLRPSERQEQRISNLRKALAVIGNLMDRYQKIIETRRVRFYSVSSTWITILTYVVMVGVCIYMLYDLNFSSAQRREDEPMQPTLFYNIAFIILAIIGSYFLIITPQKLKVRFYENNSSISRKILLIQKTADINKWKLKKKETNYFLYWENNWIFQSYYITIVIDNNGFYINSYPFLDRNLDFGASQRNSDSIYDEMKGCL